ncbi:hypothetical protein WOLCODRAFT_138977 [Wolfiporia cocos MD-104 SS10]|uniref:Zn(2)-C6 fungal-type domain-containing protein n=1 Tax=Wolfiporia cocos (strain MD-104) TaxID=742152 RepID=A0A2H3JWN6_WOLCO|nr:hypothetical protein WOLCODRAFT_138977 [Wolfiporia cocos MD-104 SS10]
MSSSVPQAMSRRRNTTLSCAECRRLKLRCSRVFPCTSCVKKGCAAICPEGSLTTGKGNRFVLANTEVLHEKITSLASRVRQLEDALLEAHSQISLEPHPLLSEELLQIKRPLEREAPEEVPPEPEPDTAEAIDAVGSLSITDAGHTKFFGTTANAWYLLQNEEGGEDAAESPQGSSPSDAPWPSYAFPFWTSASDAASVRESLIESLPDESEARRLAALYFEHAAWMYTPIPQAEFYSSVLARFYEQRAAVAIDQDVMDSHRLSILFLVIAMGLMLDLTKPPSTSEAMHYYQLSRAALSVDSILEHQTIPAIQALLLMCHFMFLSNVENPRWALMGLTVKLALTLGLHRDGNKWNLNPEEAFRRRTLFYELLTYDSWQSLTFGRPPSLSMSFIDCQIPENPTTKTDQGEPEMSFAAWKHRFVSRCQSVVHEQAFGARITSYKAILDLDRKVRDFYLPPSLRVPGFGGAKVEPESVTYEKTLQGYCAFSIREITIFYMHRGFFASALQDHPDDPLSSKYSQSVLAAYRSACAFVGLIKSLYSQYPVLTERMWFFFTHVFSCSIVLGSIPTKSPNMVLARSALSELEVACGLFEAVKHNPNAAKVLPVLHRIKSKAIQSMTEYQSRSPIPRNPAPTISVKEDDEFAALGGKTRLVSRRSPSLASPSLASPSSSHASHSQGGSSPREYDMSPSQMAGPSFSQPQQNVPQMQEPMVDVVPQWNYGQTVDYNYQQYPHYANSTSYWQQSAAMHGSMMDHEMSAHQQAMRPQPMGLDVTAIQNAEYAHVDPMSGHYVPAYMPGGGSPEALMPPPDMHWYNLMGQFNQP